MRRAFVILSLAAGSAVLFGAGRPKTPDPAAAAEVARLRNHFDVIDAELRNRDVSTLSDPQRAKREQLRAWLREYRDAGMFPKNDRFDVATPFFRDSQGTLCAMAYLIDRSGRKDIVDKVAATRNNAYIRELADDPALIAWLDEHGLSVAEAARIQPSYNDGGGIIIGPEPDDAVDSDFALAAVGLGSVSLATSAFNIARPSYLSAFLGLIAGTAAIVTGANNLDENSGTERVATATIGLGAVSLGAAVYGLLEARRERDDDRFDWREGRRKRRSMIIAPDVIVDQKSPRVGLMVRGSF